MHTITIHAAKGGSGRTTVVMALASGFLALGKRVMVMDCTSQTCRNPKCRDPSTLQTWLAAMDACRFRPPQLELTDCPTDERVEYAEIRTAFGTLPVFHSDLPASEALAEQILHGDVAHFTSMLACESGQPGYARYREAQATWSEVLALTIEHHWALQGLRLEAFEGDTSPFS